ncbi:hypothetical protein BRADI_1g31547v3 [Brachypodium distachyon]|uniref:F-box domain-containing protein n=2 Tax=Brachypodium distachyon TaxID=15368 RepID=I1GVS6_BRADI|nr:hypothetical protein BRADI_1g31547v3 [Brachypodium distachyon]PNT75391.1 hypothetical protein BRADI_1g31547v3 [Brachypodium distachyon]
MDYPCLTKRLRKPETLPSSSRSNPNPNPLSTSESPSIRRETVPPPPPPPPEGTSIITDDRLSPLPHVLQEEIFLRLATPTDLVRASLARRSFLRRFRKCHSPPLLGFMDWEGFSQVLPPHPSAPAAREVARAADFSFSFVPPPACHSVDWKVLDIRDGRVLLCGGPKIENGRLLLFPELAVCDPLHRQHRLLPPIPDDLAALVGDPLAVGYYHCSNAILVPPAPCKEDEEEKEESDNETSFRLIWMARCTTEVVTIVYSSTTGQWQSIASRSWSDLFAGQLTEPLKSSLLGRCQCAYGCLYWPMKQMPLHGLNWEAMLMLDTIRMEFALADYPPGRWTGRRIGIVEAGGSRLGLISLSDGTSHLCYFVSGNGQECSSEWEMDKVIPLGHGNSHTIIDSTERYLLLVEHNSETGYSKCFSLDVETFQLKKVWRKSHAPCGPIYANFPPSLSSGTI